MQKNSFYHIASPSAPINHITKSVKRKQIASLPMVTLEEVLMTNINANSEQE